jgi:hypothetical protein
MLGFLVEIVRVLYVKVTSRGCGQLCYYAGYSGYHEGGCILPLIKP